MSAECIDALASSPDDGDGVDAALHGEVVEGRSAALHGGGAAVRDNGPRIARVCRW